MVAAQLNEIPMTKATAKRKPTSRADDSKTRSRNDVRRTSARNTAPLKPTTAAHQQPRPAVQPTVRHESKGAHYRFSGGVDRCGKHVRLQRRQPDGHWTTRSRICAISISMACGRA